MPEINEAAYKAAIRAGRGGVYVFFGEEDYLIAHYRDKCRTPFLEDAIEAFNYIKIPYRTVEDAELIVSSVMSPPMMSSVGYKLIEVEADHFDSLPPEEVTALFDALSASAEYSDNVVIVPFMSGTFSYGDLPKKPSAVYKDLSSRKGVNCVYLPASTPAQLRRWIERHFERDGLTHDYEVAERMLNVCGTKMTVLAEEIRKVTAFVKARGAGNVTVADVDAVCSAVEEYDAFELTNAIVDGRREDALCALYQERQRRVEPVVLLGSIIRTVNDMLAVKTLAARGVSASEAAARLGMHEYRVKLYMKSTERKELSSIEAAVRACAEADEKLKSSKLGYIALERLVLTIGSKSK